MTATPGLHQPDEVEADLLAKVDTKPGISLRDLMDRASSPSHHRSRAFVHLLARKVLYLSHDQKVTGRPAPSSAQPDGGHP